ncbi:MAG: DUF167 family protein [Gammaproteobacteria bacterium]|nr:DUF167 family protein [Gammaproteobacteria bacterium]
MTLKWCYWYGDALIVKIHIQSRAPRDEVTGVYADYLRLKIAASLVGGKANRRLIGFLASELRVGRSQIKLLSGERSRDKRVAIYGPRTYPHWMPLSK